MRLRRKIISLIIIGLGFFIGSHLLGMPTIDSVYAQTNVVDGKGLGSTTTSSTTTNLAKQTTANSENNSISLEETIYQLSDAFLKMAYVILWPLIFLSGIALDNTMVYGEIFHMDLPLWQFWNFCKNIANFGLGFMILIAIIKNVFSLGDGKQSPMKIIQPAIIAGILIQMSRFLTAALIDVSTIVTYSIGGMPMNILKSDDNVTKTKILQSNVSVNLNNIKKTEVKDYKIAFQAQKKDGTMIYLSPCATKQSNTNKMYIVGRQYGDEKFRNQGKLSDTIDPKVNACIKNGKEVVFFNEFPDIANQTGATYDTILADILQVEQRNTREECGYVVSTSGTGTTNACGTTPATNIEKLTYHQRADNISSATVKPEASAGATWFNETITTSIGDMVKKTNSLIGPLATIYSSLLDFATLSDTSGTNGNAAKGIGILIIKTSIAVLLIFPLIALAVVLIVRVGFLRIIIAGSPIIILLKAFDKEKWLGGGSKYISTENILKTTFAPVITVFALSLSLVFMTTLISTFNPKTEADKLKMTEAFASINVKFTKGASDENHDTLNIMGSTIEYDKRLNDYVGAAGDWFSWMIVCFSGIGIMRFVLFAAIKQSGVFASEFGTTIQNIGQNMIGTMPIIPIGGGGAGIKTMVDSFSGGSGESVVKNMWQNSKFVDIEGQKNTMNDLKKSFGIDTEDNSKNAINTSDYFSGDNIDINKGLASLTGRTSGRTSKEVLENIDKTPGLATSINNLDSESQKAFYNNTKVDKKEIISRVAKEDLNKKIEGITTEKDLDALLKDPQVNNIPADYTTTAKIGDKTFTISMDKGGLTKKAT